MSATHTPGPYTYTGNVDASKGRKSYLILQHKRTNAANIANVIQCAGMAAEEAEANAKRIVACVNACECFSNEQLGEFHGHIEGLMIVIKELVSERNKYQYENRHLRARISELRKSLYKKQTT